jgi:hypothetical protein
MHAPELKQSVGDNLLSISDLKLVADHNSQDSPSSLHCETPLVDDWHAVKIEKECHLQASESTDRMSAVETFESRVSLELKSWHSDGTVDNLPKSQASLDHCSEDSKDQGSLHRAQFVVGTDFERTLARTAVLHCKV